MTCRCAAVSASCDVPTTFVFSMVRFLLLGYFTLYTAWWASLHLHIKSSVSEATMAAQHLAAGSWDFRDKTYFFIQRSQINLHTFL